MLVKEPIQTAIPGGCLRPTRQHPIILFGSAMDSSVSSRRILLFCLITLESVSLGLACLSSANPTPDITTTTPFPCPCALPSTDTTAECKPPIFPQPPAGVPTLTITYNTADMTCQGEMSGCTKYRIVTNGRCNNAVQTYDPATVLPLICNGGPLFLGPVDPVVKVDCQPN